MNQATRLTVTFLVLAALTRLCMGQGAPFDLLKSALQSSNTLKVTVRVKRGNDPGRSVTLALKRPGFVKLDSNDFAITSDGTTILVDDKGRASRKSTPYTLASLTECFVRDDLRLWAIFFAPNAFDGFKVKVEDPVPQDQRLLSSFRLLDPKRPGRTYAVLTDPSNHLPVQITFSTPEDPELTIVSITSMEQGAELPDSTFAVAGSTGVPDTIRATGSLTIPWTEFLRVGGGLLPSRTRISFTGSFPRDLAGAVGSPGTFTLSLDGVPLSQADSLAEWRLDWTPKESTLLSGTLRIEGRSGSKKEDMGSVQVAIRSDLPWRVESASVQPDGATLLVGDFSMFQDAQLALTCGGISLKSHLSSQGLRIWGDRFTPGQVSLQGSIVTRLGATFELPSINVDIAPFVTLEGLPTDSVQVGRAQLTESVILAIKSRAPIAKPVCRVWINGVESQGHMIDGERLEIEKYNLFDGLNDLRVMVMSGTVAYFTPPSRMTAKVDVEVQRMRASDVLLGFIEPSMSRVVTLFAQAVSGPLDPLDVPPSAKDCLELRPGAWSLAAKLAADATIKDRPRLPVTIDEAFNRRLSEVADAGIGSVERIRYCLSQLAVGFGSDGLVKRRTTAGERVSDVFGRMVDALESADGTTAEVLARLRSIRQFLVDHPGIQKDGMKAELLLMEKAGGEKRNFEIERVLRACREMASSRNDLQKLIDFQRKIDGTPDLAARGDLSKACNYFAEICRIWIKSDATKEQIRKLEIARSLATSKEEREVIAKQLADQRTNLVEMQEGAKKVREEAWRLIEASIVGLGADPTGAFDSAKREDGW